MTVVKNLPASWEVIKDEDFHEKKQVKTKEPLTTFDEEQTLEPNIEEFLTCPSLDILCIQETNHLKEGDLHGMVEEYI